MEALWFCLLSFMIVGYVLLDGYDLGVGLLHLFLAKNESQKRQMFASIAPFWDANEVWLLAAGGTAFFAFPKLYASSFSGFYLPLTILLWLLMVRGLSIELRNHISGPIWSTIWDAGFTLASGVLILFLGVALGNLMRGVPLNDEAEFFLPLWTNLTFAGGTAVIDWFTLLIGVYAVLSIATHGALWINFKVSGELQARAARVSRVGILSVIAASLLITPVIFAVQPQAAINLKTSAWGGILPLLALAALIAAFVALRMGREARAFLFYSAYLAFILGTAAFTLFPYVLRSNTGGNSLTIYNAGAGAYGLQVGLWWWVPGMLLASAYSFYLHRSFSEKVPV